MMPSQEHLQDVVGDVDFPPVEALARRAREQWWWLLCQPSPSVISASSQLLRLASPVLVALATEHDANELMV